MGTSATILVGDVREQLRTLPAESVHCIVTSPPYFGVRCYGTEPQVWGDGWVGELGSEPHVSSYVAHLVEVFREVRRVLRKDGVLWLNLGDSYVTAPAGNTGPANDDDGAYQRRRDNQNAATGEDPQRRPVDWRSDRLKPKDLIGIPWRVALALQDDGWWLRADCIWHKPNPLPESCRDRPMTKDKEYVFLLAKGRDYFWDGEDVREPATGRSVTHQLSSERYDATVNGPHSSGRKFPPGKERSVPVVFSTRVLRSVWKITAQPFHGAHFATFPEALAERCIRAGTSRGGVCAGCGKPWERVVCIGEPDLEHQRTCGGDRKGEYHGQAQKAFEFTGAQNASNAKRNILKGMGKRTTVGWKPDCKCDVLAVGPPVPATVLDPFLGSGTTLLVARRLGHHGIGIELKPEYAEIAKERVAG